MKIAHKEKAVSDILYIKDLEEGPKK